MDTIIVFFLLALITSASVSASVPTYAQINIYFSQDGCSGPYATEFLKVGACEVVVPDEQSELVSVGIVNGLPTLTFQKYTGVTCSGSPIGSPTIGYTLKACTPRPSSANSALGDGNVMMVTTSLEQIPPITAASIVMTYYNSLAQCDLGHLGGAGDIIRQNTLPLSRCQAADSGDPKKPLYVKLACAGTVDDDTGNSIDEVTGNIFLDSQCTVPDTAVPAQPSRSIYSLLGGGGTCSVNPYAAADGPAEYMKYNCENAPPTPQPTPTAAPNGHARIPTASPTRRADPPSTFPTRAHPASIPPSALPTASPSLRTLPPTRGRSPPSASASALPTASPSVTARPSSSRGRPSNPGKITRPPSAAPSTIPSAFPSAVRTAAPSGLFPRRVPTNTPNKAPSRLRPTHCPTSRPTSTPTSIPTSRPSCVPSSQPSNAPTGVQSGKGAPTPTPKTRKSVPSPNFGAAPTVAPTAAVTGPLSAVGASSSSGVVLSMDNNTETVSIAVICSLVALLCLSFASYRYFCVSSKQPHLPSQPYGQSMSHHPGYEMSPSISPMAGRPGYLVDAIPAAGYPAGPSNVYGSPQQHQQYHHQQQQHHHQQQPSPYSQNDYGQNVPHITHRIGQTGQHPLGGGGGATSSATGSAASPYSQQQSRGTFVSLSTLQPGAHLSTTDDEQRHQSRGDSFSSPVLRL